MDNPDQTLIHYIIDSLKLDLDDAQKQRCNYLTLLNHGSREVNSLRARVKELNNDISYISYQIKDLSKTL